MFIRTRLFIKSRLSLKLTLVFLLFGLVPAARGGQQSPRNLALAAHASAFEAGEGLGANQANDGNMETRWSGIPGHDTGGWFELAWDQPVRLSEVVIVQYDRFVNEMDLQAWDQNSQAWVTLKHLQGPGQKLPKTVICPVQPTTTRRLRLANIDGGPSFSEVQVFEEPPPPVVHLASDADGHFIGMVCDPWGSAPIPNMEVSLSGRAASGPWHTAASSDKHGLFFAPMPLGLAGPVSASLNLPQSAQPLEAALPVDASRFQYGLTPENLSGHKLDLNGIWRFASDPPANFWDPAFDDRGWADIKVPAHIAMQGFQSINGVGGYRRRFRAPTGTGRLKLRFDGVYSGAEVWLNGRRLAYHEGGALPFEVDITDAAGDHDNLLAVRVAEHTVVSDKLDQMSRYANFPLAGIMRPVYVFRVPPAHIGALALTPKFDESFRDGKIEARVAILNESDQPLSQASLEFRLTDPDGRPVPLAVKPSVAEVGPWQRGEVQVALPVSAPRHWDAEHPNRYTLETILKTRGRYRDRVTQKIGFRQTEVRGSQLFINGQPVKIRGACHHDSDPLLGRAVTAAMERQDLTLMKEANLNALRTSHYPPLPALIDIADELGIYVEDEGPFCWSGAETVNDLRMTPRIMQLSAELLARDRNHPSVFIWSLCNESSFGFAFERIHEWLRTADPGRPHGGTWNRSASIDFLVRHNPVAFPFPYGDVPRSGPGKKPILWDEAWCVFQGIDTAEMWLDPGIRDYYAEPLLEVYARMMQSNNIVGTQIWAWSDDLFCLPNRGVEYVGGGARTFFVENEYHLPGRGVVGCAPWGVVDGWRRKKPEFWITKKLHSPVKIKEWPLDLPAPGQPIRVMAENQYDFTDLNELRLKWEIAGKHGVTHCALAPHQTGALEISPGLAPTPSDHLKLEFTDRQGRLVDACNLTFSPAVPQWPELRQSAPTPLRIIPENYLVGPATRIVGQDFELAFDQATGALYRAVEFGQVMMLEWPHLHILPTAAPLSALPDSRSWSLGKLVIKADGENVRARLEGGYDHFTGGYDLLISPAGDITVHSSFKYTGNKVLAREIGLAFSVPKECDLLRWQRRGEWSLYPSDHIGRPIGATRALAPHREQVPPAWPWGEDNSPMGCNDFRSTKRHIDWASLSYPNGPGVWVQSDGSQHARAMVDTDRIRLHISDWYGGTHNPGLLEWSANYSDGKPIASGDIIESTVKLHLGQLRAVLRCCK